MPCAKKAVNAFKGYGLLLNETPIWTAKIAITHNTMYSASFTAAPRTFTMEAPPRIEEGRVTPVC
jgi:hypothetical protein